MYSVHICVPDKSSVDIISKEVIVQVSDWGQHALRREKKKERDSVCEKERAVVHIGQNHCFIFFLGIACSLPHKKKNLPKIKHETKSSIIPSLLQIIHIIMCVGMGNAIARITDLHVQVWADILTRFWQVEEMCQCENDGFTDTGHLHVHIYICTVHLHAHMCVCTCTNRRRKHIILRYRPPLLQNH